MTRKALAAAIGLPLLICCVVLAEDEAARIRDERSIRETLDTALTAFNNGDLDGYLELHTEDAIVFAPNREPEVGRAAIRAAAASLFAGSKIRETRSVEEIKVNGSWGFVRGAYDSTVTPKAGGPSSHDTGNYLEIVQRDRGKWRYSRSIWNSNH